MQFEVVAGFFLLGVIAKLSRSGLEIPASLYQSIVIFLMLAIGLKGGTALNSHASLSILPQSLMVILFGLALPLAAFPFLYFFGRLSRVDAASIAAHYGSVSIGTYAVAISFLQSQQIEYEAYFPLFVVLLEMPAIATGIWLANADTRQFNPAKVMHEVFLNQSVMLLLGGLTIGWWAGENASNLMTFFDSLFPGVLALFLLKMGMIVGASVGSIRQSGSFIASFGVFMPLFGASCGGLLAIAMGLSVGGTILLATLGASASYIAVPAAMAVALPGANQSLSITATLAVTFPFNVMVGIPIYSALTKYLLT
jgi:uncharacterized protein